MRLNKVDLIINSRKDDWDGYEDKSGLKVWPNVSTVQVFMVPWWCTYAIVQLLWKVARILRLSMYSGFKWWKQHQIHWMSCISVLILCTVRLTMKWLIGWHLFISIRFSHSLFVCENFTHIWYCVNGLCLLFTEL